MVLDGPARDIAPHGEQGFLQVHERGNPWSSNGCIFGPDHAFQHRDRTGELRLSFPQEDALAPVIYRSGDGRHHERALGRVFRGRAWLFDQVEDRSLTVLDQRNRTAVTMARLALFAGLAPPGGMRFSPETAVFPVIPTTNEPTGGYVDWTQTQNLASGWLPAARGRSSSQSEMPSNDPASNSSRPPISPSSSGMDSPGSWR